MKRVTFFEFYCSVSIFKISFFFQFLMTWAASCRGYLVCSFNLNIWWWYKNCFFFTRMKSEYIWWWWDVCLFLLLKLHWNLVFTNLEITLCLKSKIGSLKTLYWKSPLKSLILTVNLVITKDFVLTEAYCNYKISLYMGKMTTIGYMIIMQEKKHKNAQNLPTYERGGVADWKHVAHDRREYRYR